MSDWYDDARLLRGDDYATTRCNWAESLASDRMSSRVTSVSYLSDLTKLQAVSDNLVTLNGTLRDLYSQSLAVSSASTWAYDTSPLRVSTVSVSGSIGDQFQSPAFKELYSYWTTDGGKYNGDATLSTWTSEAVSKHKLLVAENFDSFFSDLASAAGVCKAGLTATIDAGELNTSLQSWLDTYAYSNSCVWTPPKSTAFVNRLSRTRIRYIWRGITRWANRARGDLTRDVAIRHLFQVLRARLGRQVHRVLVEHEHTSFTSTRARVFEFEFRVGNPPPMDAHAAVGSESSKAMHVIINKEADYEQVLGFKDSTRLRDWERARRAESRSPAGAVALWRSSSRQRMA